MPEWGFGIDTSYAQVSLEKARELKLYGVLFAAQCLWTGAEQPATRVINLRNYHNAGIAIVGYISVASHHPGEWHVDQGRAGVPDDLWTALRKVPIDVELTGLDYATHVVRAWDRAAALGKPQDCYTSYHAWHDLLGNPDRRPGVGLWNAYWDGDPDVDFPSLRFGRWEDNEVWAEQWSGGTNVQGVFADRNQARLDRLAIALPPAPAPQPPTVPAPTPPPAPSDAQWLGAARILARATDLTTQRRRLTESQKAAVRFIIG